MLFHFEWQILEVEITWSFYSVKASSKHILIRNVFIWKNIGYLLFYAKFKIIFFAVGISDMAAGGNAGQCINPPFVYSVVVPDIDW